MNTTLTTNEIRALMSYHAGQIQSALVTGLFSDATKAEIVDGHSERIAELTKALALMAVAPESEEAKASA